MGPEKVYCNSKANIARSGKISKRRQTSCALQDSQIRLALINETTYFHDVQSQNLTNMCEMVWGILGLLTCVLSWGDARINRRFAKLKVNLDFDSTDFCNRDLCSTGERVQRTELCKMQDAHAVVATAPVGCPINFGLAILFVFWCMHIWTHPDTGPLTTK